MDVLMGGGRGRVRVRLSGAFFFGAPQEAPRPFSAKTCAPALLALLGIRTVASLPLYPYLMTIMSQANGR